MPIIIGLLVVIVVILCPIILVVLLVAGVSLLAIIAWLASKLIWFVLGGFVLFMVAYVAMYIHDPKGMREGLAEANREQERKAMLRKASKVKMKAKR